MKVYKTIHGKTIIEVLAYSEKQAKFKIHKRYGFYPSYVEEQKVDVIHYDPNLSDAVKHQIAMNYRSFDATKE